MKKKKKHGGKEVRHPRGYVKNGWNILKGRV